MSVEAVFKGVYPIGDTNLSELPVKEIGPAVAFYQKVLGFSVVASDSTRVELKRGEARIGLIRKEDHDPRQAGSCYFDVSDVEALRLELETTGGIPVRAGSKTTRARNISRSSCVRTKTVIASVSANPHKQHSSWDAIWRSSKGEGRLIRILEPGTGIHFPFSAEFSIIWK